jgi:hypothetical protein
MPPAAWRDDEVSRDHVPLMPTGRHAVAPPRRPCRAPLTGTPTHPRPRRPAPPRPQDEKLRRAIKMHKKDWPKIAASVGRTVEDVQDRWKNVLHPRLSRGPWTPEVRGGWGGGRGGGAGRPP